jgi:AAA15 family ATPase/GTPase
MQEKIVVENFGGITEAEINLKKINIFIGPQASGKSVLAKLIYFLTQIPQ